MKSDEEDRRKEQTAISGIIPHPVYKHLTKSM
jgi:hypothetical protein